LQKGDAPKAVREFERLRDLYPRSAQARYLLAVAYLVNGQATNAVDDAINNLNEAVQLEPRFVEAALLLAELRIRKGNPASAIDSLEKVVRERPQIAQAQFLLASAYLAQRNTEQALALFRQMTESFKQDPRPPFLMGMILADRGQQADARKAFE